jgi:hypothetical protein
MYLTKLKPNWRHLHGLKGKPFIHFNLQTFGLSQEIPYDFMRSFNDLPSDKYVPNNDPVTRSRRYANLKIDVTDNYKYELQYTNNNIFQQKVDDNRGVIRQFELIDIYHVNQIWLLDFLTQISALSVLNHNYYKGHNKIKEVDIHLHQVRQTAYYDVEAHNSPEGIHRDGCDYIVSAMVIMRNNVIDGESIIYDQNKMINYKTILDDQEGIFQEDTKQWHYVTPIRCISEGIGFRDILGIDIILNT